MGWINSVEGQFIFVHPDKTTKSNLEEWCKRNKIPNLRTKEHFHCTIAHTESMAFVMGKPHCDVTVDAESIKIETWELPDKGDGIRYALVLTFESDALRKRYDELSSQGVKCKYDDFKPHLTLSMDVGAFFRTRDLQYHNPLRFVREEIKTCRNY